MSIDHLILQLVNGSYSCFLDSFIPTITWGWTWIFMYLALAFTVIKNNKTMSQIMLIFGCVTVVLLFSGGINDLFIKPYVGRPRPCYDPAAMNIIHHVKGLRVSGYSFFSSHAANTFSLAMFFCLLTRSVTLSSTLFVWAAINGYTRIYLGAHYFTDVLVGTLWGLTVGSLVYYLLYRKVYRRISTFARYVSTKYTVTGYAYADINAITTIFILTIIGSVIIAMI